MIENENKTAAADYDKQIRKYEYFLKDRQASIEQENASVAIFEKTLTTLSSGALALSITFAKFFGGEPKGKEVLFVAWCCFGLALLVLLIGFLCSCRAQIRYRAIITAIYTGNACEPRNTLATLTNYLNWLALFAFIVGVVCFALFVASNLQ